MSTKVQIRRGSTSSANAFTGAEGELYVDIDQNDLRVHDGSTPGGFRLPNFDTVTELNSTKVDKLSPPFTSLSNTVGSSTSIPVITFNEQGQITAVSSAALPNNLATTTYVDTAVSNLVNAAPSTLNTLNELASALGNDASFATTVTNQLALKANTSSLATVATTGSYSNLTNKPTIPTLTSQLTNDAGFLTANNTITFKRTNEVFTNISSYSATIEYNYTDGNIFYQTNLTNNYDANFTNIPTTELVVTTCSLIIEHVGSNAYIPNNLYINGVLISSVKWLSQPTPVANTTGIITYVMIRRNSTWNVLGSYASYGL
jgi:hypothetical protein